MELTGAGEILYDHANRALRLLRNAEERIDYEGAGSSLSLSICAGDSWGNAILPDVMQRFMVAHAEIDVRLDIIGAEARMAGLASGNYDLSYGISLPRHEGVGKVAFTPMLRAPYIVYAAGNHPLRRPGSRPMPEDLLTAGWIKHKFEYDHDPAQWQKTNRNYVLSTNTMLSTLEMVRQTELLMSTSEVFREIFARHQVFELCPDPLTGQHVSGLHTLRSATPSYPAQLFSTFCQAHLPAIGLRDNTCLLSVD